MSHSQWSWRNRQPSLLVEGSTGLWQDVRKLGCTGLILHQQLTECQNRNQMGLGREQEFRHITELESQTGKRTQTLWYANETKTVGKNQEKKKGLCIHVLCFLSIKSQVIFKAYYAPWWIQGQSTTCPSLAGSGIRQGQVYQPKVAMTLIVVPQS